VAGHEDHALVHEIIGDGHGLLRVAGIVADFELQLFAVHAAGGVDIGNRLFGTPAHLFAESRILTGHRASGGDDDIGLSHAGIAKAGKQGNGGKPGFQLLHAILRKSPPTRLDADMATGYAPQGKSLDTTPRPAQRADTEFVTRGRAR